MDINTKQLKKNAFRVTKERGKTAARIRVPGGHMEANLLAIVQEIAQRYGNGTVHITTRQGFEIPGIDMKNIPKINEMLEPLLTGLGINHKDPKTGYPASGTRNIAACIGNRVCPFANFDTTALAQRIEGEVFPNDYHVKIAITGCPNDCIKTRMHDIGIIGMTEPQYDAYRCIGCQACVTNCKKRATGALKFENFKVVRDHEKCIGCGECVLKCPTGAWTRSKNKLFKLVIMGRTGKKNPRIAQDFIKWIDEESIIKIIKNMYLYIDEFIDRDAPGGKEHVGYIVDRTGYQVFKEWVLRDVKLNPEAEVAEYIYWK
ncbi:Anaerobic sulfite reductase subunit C [Caloramator mitchellensis]|uniref:Anaerobic sulfite reductase subunit C n=1 Tax=Caloramator mitchellensis TaxID=908809 RepID=A0A0R3JTA2_CALMK|nr:sulfite reductase subunit C [Caloramator mitchellensis]KRQ86753.1 Anaerobic sulfite reductase subunit C [Caloramator mitchellensis]